MGLYVNTYFVYQEKKSEEQLTDQTNSKTLKIKTTIVKLNIEKPERETCKVKSHLITRRKVSKAQFRSFFQTRLLNYRGKTK